MKFIQPVFAFFAACLLMVSCQKEYSFEGGTFTQSQGTLKSTAGECLPSVVNGIYRTGTALLATNYIDVQIDVTAVGGYSIVSDTINGFSFKGTGEVVVAGINTVRLTGTGNPLAAGTNTFTIRYGTSSCNIDVTVIDASTGASVYTFGGAGGTCTGATLNGTYKVGVPTDASNSITLTVDVTTPGTYTILVTGAGGVNFSGTGVFSTTGLQNVTLGASGTPPTAGTFNALVGTSPNSCTFSITVVPASSGSAATYTLGGNGSTCSGTVLSGTYMAGTATGASNTAVIDVTVATPGTYSISTPAVNGVTFSAIGTFAAAGPTTVSLVASGVPAAAGPFSYAVNGATSTCTFQVTYLPAAPPAAFTLGGAPGNCTGAVVNGTYTAGTATGASNTAVINVNVTTVGAYAISTTAVNGVTFSATGVFTTATAQTVTLTASGTPTAAGAFTYPVTGNSSTCNFSVNTAAASTFRWKFNVGPTLYQGNSDPAEVITATGVPDILDMPGTADNGTGLFDLGIANTTGGFGTGTYAGNTLVGKIGGFNYDDGAIYFEADPTLGTNVTIIVTVYNTTTRIIEGTFSGTAHDDAGANVQITNGTFKFQLP